ncbi:KEOPS complex subunit Pcc1 [Methanobrevibacter sp. DSM 116169]|uniref:KEOPS complex subunit Pcc1 n=1 Tax=Methanobrevibacter sp. DSM 116169 TaxID=3242727 RepID=UPI0038FC0073
MKINAKIKIEYNDYKIAEISHESLKVDNEGFVESEIKNNEVIYTINSESLGSFLLTADDLIASHILTEELLNSQNNKNKGE